MAACSFLSDIFSSTALHAFLLRDILKKTPHYDKFMSIKSSHPGRRGLWQSFQGRKHCHEATRPVVAALSLFPPDPENPKGADRGFLKLQPARFSAVTCFTGGCLGSEPRRQHCTRSDCHLQGGPGTGAARTLCKHTGTEVVTKIKGSCGRVVVATSSTEPSPRSLPLSPR